MFVGFGITFIGLSTHMYSTVYRADPNYIYTFQTGIPEFVAEIASQQNIFLCINIKAGHPQFKSAPPQLRNIADNQNDCGVAD
jgi:hypothetical protein